MKDKSLKDFLDHQIINQIIEIGDALPDGCTSCKWRKICKGGDLENRYSDISGFNNPSVYCEAYKLNYQNVSNLLISSGYPNEMIPIA